MLRLLTVIALSLVITLTASSCASMKAGTGSSVKLEKVESSLIKAVGYDADSQVLAVQFATTGEVFEYEGVPEKLYQKMISAKSIGSFYTKRIKGKFKSSKK